MILAKHFSVACFPYPEPVYTGWSSAHWDATGMPLVNPAYTGIPLGHPANTCRVHWKDNIWNCLTLECHWRNVNIFRLHWNTTGKNSWNCPTLGCHWRNFCSLHWNTTGGTVVAPTHAQAHIVKQNSIHASLRWQDGEAPISKWTGLCKFSFYLEFTALQWIPVLLLNMWVLQHHSVHAFDLSSIIVSAY